MKTPRIVNAVGQIDEDLIAAASTETCAKIVRINPAKWGAVAACLAVVVMASAAVLPMLLRKDAPVTPVAPAASEGAEPASESASGKDDELAIEKVYAYSVDEGKYAAYTAGKVIALEKIGKKLSDVNVTGGWMDAAGEWISTEKLGAEVYEIEGISPTVAVALRFIDQGEAVTTAHYYALLNPAADLTPVAEYVIAPILPVAPGEFVEE